MNSAMNLHESLRQEKPLFGLVQTLPNPSLTELAALCGYDFLILDGEHGWFGEMDYLHTLLALGSVATAGIVRVRNHDAQAIGRYLDMGAAGILVPNVSTGAQAVALVRAMQYPPAGTRGFAAPAMRASSYGMNLAAHLKSPRGHAFLAVMIETALGASNADEILGIEGVDAVVVGPFDLTADLGCPGDFAHSAYAEALERIERAALSRGKALGSAPHPGHPLEVLVARGHRLITLGVDMSLMRDALQAPLATARASG